MKKNIRVSWAFGNNVASQIDFGLFKAHKKNTIMVDKEFWSEYVEARLRYEVMQHELFDMINKKGRDKK